MLVVVVFEFLVLIKTSCSLMANYIPYFATVAQHEPPVNLSGVTDLRFQDWRVAVPGLKGLPLC
jgi:hypothetical protein